MTLTCLFCKKDLNYAQNCDHCDIPISYWLSGDFDKNIDAIQFNVGPYDNKNYIIDVDYIDKMTLLLDDGQHRIFSINYVIDINPENANKWLEKLLKMKIFS